VTIHLAAPLLKERISLIRWVGMALSLVAIVLINSPGEQRGISAWMLAALIAIVLWGVVSLVQKASTFHLSGTGSAFLVPHSVCSGRCLYRRVEPLPRERDGP
jgi:drug/metabolite transporter (DMT)-like permease